MAALADRIGEGPEDGLLRWRPRALTILIWVTFFARLPHTLNTVLGPVSGTMGPLARIAVPFHLAYLGLALARRMNHVLRAWAFLCLQSASVVILLLGLGLSGMGRMLLVVQPIYALVLLGRRPGLIWAALSLLLYAAVTAAVGCGVLAHTLLLEQNSTKLGVWVVSGSSLVAVILPSAVLLERFLALLQRTSDSEHAAHRRLEAETRERRLLDVALMETSERERTVVGHELHDGVCQQLTAAMLRCQVLQRTLREKDAPEAGPLRAIVDLLDESLSHAHDLARGLSPGDLEPGALGPALRDLARRARETRDLVCEVEEDGCGAGVDRTVAMQLYRIAQEAVTNALKHGDPGHVWIRLLRDEAGVRLEVENDGRSLRSDNGAGMGVRIMRNRAARAGGELTLGARPEGGTTLRCSAPLRGKAPP